MNELAKISSQLPDTIEDLTQFVLVGKAKLQAYMLKLQTINKLSTAQEIRDQTLQEAQEISTALIAAEQRIGELLLAIPKATGNQYTSASVPDSTEAKTKTETVKEMGYGREYKDYQRMAQNPEVVQKVIEDALSKGEVVTKTAVMKEIKALNDRIRDLESREPETKVVERVVVPEDYKDLKKKAREAKDWEQDFHRQQEKVGEKQREILRLQDEIKKLQEQTVREQLNNDFVAGALYFIAQCGNFIKDVAGYVWIADKLADLPEKDRTGYVKAAKAVQDWSTALLQTIEMDKEYGEPELRKLIG